MLRASYARVHATVGVGTVLIWDFGVAYTRGGGYKEWQEEKDMMRTLEAERAQAEEAEHQQDGEGKGKGVVVLQHDMLVQLCICRNAPLFFMCGG